MKDMDETEVETQTEDAAETPKRRPLKKLVLLGGLTLAALIGGLVWAGLVPLGGSDDAAETAAAEDEAGAASAEDAGTELMQMEEILVNVAGIGLDGTPQPRILRIELALAYQPDVLAARPDAGTSGVTADDTDASDPIARDAPFIRDAFIRYLRQLDETDLAGSGGLADLKRELAKRARLVVGGEGVVDVLISDVILE